MRAGLSVLRGKIARMDWLTFVSNLVSALAWPLLAAGVLIFGRSYVQRTIGRVIELIDERVSDLSIGRDGLKIQRAIHEAAKALEPRAEESSGPDAATDLDSAEDEDDTRDLSQRLADLHPPSAIIFDATRVERALDSALRSIPGALVLNRDGKHYKGLRSLIGIAAKVGILTPSQAKSAEALSRIRNEAAHLSPNVIDRSTAEEFSEIADHLIFDIRRNTRLREGLAPNDH